MAYSAEETPAAGEAVDDGVPLPTVGAGRREVVLLVAPRLPRHQVLAVGVGRAEQRRVPVVAHDESTRECVVDREVGAFEVAEGEDVVPAAGRQEAAVALGAPRIPTVARIRMTARAPRVGVGELHPPVRVDGRAAHARKLLERLAVDREVAAVQRTPPVEVGGVACQPPEVAVERPVLHHAHDDRVDPAVARRTVEHGVPPSTGVRADREEAAAAEHRGPTEGESGLEEITPIHAAC